MQGLPAADSDPLPHLYQWADSLRSIVTQLGAFSKPPAGSGVAPADVNTLQQQLLLLHQAQNQGTDWVGDRQLLPSVNMKECDRAAQQQAKHEDIPTATLTLHAQKINPANMNPS
jgi:hypothetical protein